MTTASDVQGWMEASGAVIAALGTVAAFGATFWSLKVQQRALATERKDRLDESRARIESLKDGRRRSMRYALDEIAGAVETLDRDWRHLPLRRESIDDAYLLVVEHARNWSGPMRDLRAELDGFEQWRQAVGMVTMARDANARRDALMSRLLGANRLLEDLLSAVDRPPASGPRWGDIPAE